jgi:hypothetical protein
MSKLAEFPSEPIDRQPMSRADKLIALGLLSASGAVAFFALVGFVHVLRWIVAR